MDLIFMPRIGVFEGKEGEAVAGEVNKPKKSRRRAPRLEARRLPRRAHRRGRLGRSPQPLPVERIALRLRQPSQRNRKKGLLAGQSNEDGGPVGKEAAPIPNNGTPCRQTGPRIGAPAKRMLGAAGRVGGSSAGGDALPGKAGSRR